MVHCVGARSSELLCPAIQPIAGGINCGWSVRLFVCTGILLSPNTPELKVVTKIHRSQ